MIRRRRIILALLLSGLAAALTGLPYLAASWLAPSGAQFGGFLVNPWDGFSYLAKMRQGADGGWLFRLPYAIEPGEGAFLFGYYLALGHLAAGLGASLLGVYHGARLLASFGMFAAAYALLGRVLPAEAERRIAFLLILFGSGLGWLGAPLGLISADLLMPEAIPFFSAYANAHFPLGLMLLLLGAYLVLDPRADRKHMLAGVLVGACLAIVLPFSAVSLMLIVAVWLAWEAIAERRLDLSAIWMSHGASIRSGAALALGASPLLAYQYWTVRSHPALQAWNAQNQTPSPPIWDYAVGFGLVLGFAIVGLLRARKNVPHHFRFLLVWALVNAALLYVPFNLQRRWALGLYVPLAGLAALGLVALSRRGGRWTWLPAIVLMLSIPSNALVVLAGLTQVWRGEAVLVLEESELAGYRWMAEHATSEALVLAAPLSGNRLPAFAPVRVVYGHPFETPNAAAMRDRVLDLFERRGSAEPGLGELGVDLIFYGPQERRLGSPAWLKDLDVAHASPGVTIYQVP